MYAMKSRKQKEKYCSALTYLCQLYFCVYVTLVLYYSRKKKKKFKLNQLCILINNTRIYLLSNLEKHAFSSADRSRSKP